MCNSCQSKFSCPNKKKGKHFFQKLDINCPFYMHTAWRLENRKKRKIVCTNYLIKGTQCKADTWYYNILVPSHFSIMHLINEWPHIDTAEIELMKKMKNRMIQSKQCNQKLLYPLIISIYFINLGLDLFYCFIQILSK